MILASEGECLEDKDVEEYPIDNMNDDVDQMVPWQPIAVKIIIQSKTEIG